MMSDTNLPDIPEEDTRMDIETMSSKNVVRNSVEIWTLITTNIYAYTLCF